MSEELKPIELHGNFLNSYYDSINLQGQFRLKEMREDPVKFAKFMLGFTARDYQAYLIKQILDHQKVAIVKGRQIGFSTTISLFCLWAAYFNKFKSGATGNTKICVISKDDDAAKKLLQSIKDFMYMGDAYMSKFLKGKKDKNGNLLDYNQMFSREIVVNNVDQLKLKNGAIIYSFPPTGKVRGTSNDILFIDETAFLGEGKGLDVEKFYYTDALPSISETAGKIIVSSTPNGYGGLYYEIIDPEGKRDEHEFHRFMFPFTVNKDNPNYLEQVELFKKHMDPKKFAQEYLCDFTQNDISYFNSEKVEQMFDAHVRDINPDDYEHIASVDYGMSESRTVITLCSEIEGTITRTYYKEFESGWDINGVIPFMEGLKDRFRINKIVVDQCPQGDAINKKMIEMGWNIELFDFHTKKIETYQAFKNRMNKGEVKIAPDTETERQFYEMQQEESKTGKLMIHKPKGGRDDIVDGMIMASSHYLGTKETIGAYLI